MPASVEWVSECPRISHGLYLPDRGRTPVKCLPDVVLLCLEDCYCDRVVRRDCEVGEAWAVNDGEESFDLLLQFV